MGKNFNYYLAKDEKTKEMIYLEYEKINNGYKLTPKAKRKDAISVNKIVFVSPTMTEKLLRHKIDHRINELLKHLKEIDDMPSGDDETGESIKKSLLEAERLKLAIINNYIKYLGNTYQSLTLKKIQIIINQLRIKLYLSRSNNYEYDKLMFFDERKGKGR